MSTIANLYSDVKTLCQQWFYTKTEVDTALDSLVDTIYPIGSIYMSVNSTSPQTLFGGTWEQIEDKFLLASGTSYSNGATGGSATVSLTKAQMPRHTHTQDGHSHGMAHTHNHHHMMFEGNAWSNGSGKVSAYTKQTNRSAFQGYTTYDNTASSKSDTDSTTAINQYTGGTNTTQAEQNGSAHENMPPYLAVNVWKRTA